MWIEQAHAKQDEGLELIWIRALQALCQHKPIRVGVPQPNSSFATAEPACPNTLLDFLQVETKDDYQGKRAMVFKSSL